MTYHVKRSPSQAKKFSICFGALALCEALPDWARGNSSDAARLGTAAHGVIEYCLGHGVAPETLRGRIIELVGEEENAVLLKPNAKTPKRSQVWYEVDETMIEGTTLMTEYVNDRIAELGGPNYCRVMLESRTNPLPERDDTSGTADVTIDVPKKLLEVVDYKNGWNVVEHIDNDQLRAYLLGKALEAKFSHKRYLITIVQPNADHEEGKIRTFEMTVEDLKQFQIDYRKVIAKNEEAENHKHAPTKENLDDGVNPVWAKKFLNAGDDAEHCMFCDAAGSGKCPARIGFAAKAAAIDFADEPEALPEPQNANEAAAVLAWQGPMTRLFAQCAKYVQLTLENGFTAAGYKLVRTKTARKRRDDMTELEWAAGVVSEYKIPEKALYTRALKSGPQVEKLIPKKLRAEFNDKYLTKPTGNLTVAPEDDKREAVLRSAADDFEDTYDDSFDDFEDDDFG